VPLLAAAAIATALALAACGSSNGGLIPSETAGTLTSDLNNIQAGVAAGNCPVTDAAIESATIDFESLPSSIDKKLASQLQQGFKTLTVSAELQCGTSSGTGSTGTTGSTSTSSTSSSSSTTSSTTTSSTTTSSAATTSTSSSAATTTTPTTTGSSCTPVTTTNGGTVCEGPTGTTSSNGIGGGGIGGPGN
jgi:hypothetical protein